MAFFQKRRDRIAGGSPLAISTADRTARRLSTRSHMSPIDVHAIAERVRSEFNEMPGLRLTARQAAKLWGLDGPSCGAVIDILIRSSFLRWTQAGTVARVES
jgi:hypothetical protein